MRFSTSVPGLISASVLRPFPDNSDSAAAIHSDLSDRAVFDSWHRKNPWN
jgi:hypothetical protein